MLKFKDQNQLVKRLVKYSPNGKTQRMVNPHPQLRSSQERTVSPQPRIPQSFRFVGMNRAQVVSVLESYNYPPERIISLLMTLGLF